MYATDLSEDVTGTMVGRKVKASRAMGASEALQRQSSVWIELELDEHSCE